MALILLFSNLFIPFWNFLEEGGPWRKDWIFFLLFFGNPVIGKVPSFYWSLILDYSFLGSFFFLGLEGLTFFSSKIISPS